MIIETYLYTHSNDYCQFEYISYHDYQNNYPSLLYGDYVTHCPFQLQDGGILFAYQLAGGLFIIGWSLTICSILFCILWFFPVKFALACLPW